MNTIVKLQGRWGTLSAAGVQIFLLQLLCKAKLPATSIQPTIILFMLQPTKNEVA